MLNRDYKQKLAINTADMAWEKSPSKGVLRKKLEREAVESGVTTSIVKYEAGCSFSTHTHPQGEEIFVLDGVFEDENGQYPAGSYIRNPAGSHHAPFSTKGCTLFVKLNQFNKNDNQQIIVDTKASPWHAGMVEGLTVMPLHSFYTENTALVRWAPNTYFKPHTHLGGEEILVLDGVFEDEYGQYPAGTWLRSPSYSKHNPFSKNGCTILVKTGHLPT